MTTVENTPHGQVPPSASDILEDYDDAGRLTKVPSAPRAVVDLTWETARAEK